MTVDLVIDGQLNLCISKEIIHEVLDVLAHKFSRGPEELSRTAVFLSDLAELVAPRRKLAVLDHEPDNRIVECAVASHADIIVTGDRALVNRYAGRANSTGRHADFRNILRQLWPTVENPRPHSDTQ